MSSVSKKKQAQEPSIPCACLVCGAPMRSVMKADGGLFWGCSKFQAKDVGCQVTWSPEHGWGPIDYLGVARASKHRNRGSSERAILVLRLVAAQQADSQEFAAKLIDEFGLLEVRKLLETA